MARNAGTCIAGFRKVLESSNPMACFQLASSQTELVDAKICMCSSSANRGRRKAEATDIRVAMSDVGSSYDVKIHPNVATNSRHR